jgi:hypothetical protein
MAEERKLAHDPLRRSTIPTAAATGRLEESRRLPYELVDVVAELTPHHRDAEQTAYLTKLRKNALG